MTVAGVPKLETLQADGIVALARTSGPCMTVYLPPYRPGAQTNSPSASLKTSCQDAERQLAARKVPDLQIAELIEPLRRLADEAEFTAGSHWGRVFFRSPDVFAKLDGIECQNPIVNVGSGFLIRPLLVDLHLPPAFFLLRLTKKQVELWRCGRTHADMAELPKGVPHTLDDALEFKPPDHDLENRSPAGSSIGSMRGVRFGTGGERDNARVYLADFFKAVDRGIKELGHGEVPLVLAGVEEDNVIYRAVSGYKNLLKQSLPGTGHAPFSEAELEQARALIRSDSLAKAAASLAELKERMAPERVSYDLDAILGAAVDGRVGWIYINRDAQVFGIFDGIRRPGQVQWGEDDLLNVAALETIVHDGQAFALPDDKMPDGAAVVAVFRY